MGLWLAVWLLGRKHQGLGLGSATSESAGQGRSNETSEPRFPNVENGDRVTPAPRVVVGTDLKLLCIEDSAQSLARGKYPMYVHSVTKEM